MRRLATLRLVAVTNVQPLWGIVVRKEINQISDLKAKKLGVSSFGGTSYSAALYILKHYGLKPQEDVAILATGGTVERIAAGGQPTDTSRTTDLAGVALAVGVRGAMTVRDTASFQAAVDDAINSKGLRFIVANVALAQGPAPRARLSHREGLLRFVRIPRGNGKENDTAHGTYVTLELRGY